MVGSNFFSLSSYSASMEKVKFDDGWYLIEMKSLMDVGRSSHRNFFFASDMAPSAVFFSFLLGIVGLVRREEETIVPEKIPQWNFVKSFFFF